MPEHPSQPDPAPAKRRPASAFVAAATRDWEAYYDHIAGKPPRETLLWALGKFAATPPPDAPEPALAIDLGCGEGRDTAELLRQGWRVLAQDSHPSGIERLLARADLVHTDRLTTSLEPFERVELPAATLINASFSLPFCPPEAFDGLWDRITGSASDGGRFAGQFFGDRDDWAVLPDRTHHTRAEVERLLDGFVIERLEEEERDGSDAEGNAKHWHIFHVLARKR